MERALPRNGRIHEETQGRVSCRDSADHQVRLQLFALACNPGKFLQRLALPVKHWTLTTLRDKLIKIGAKVVHHTRQVVFQLAEVAIPPCSPPS